MSKLTRREFLTAMAALPALKLALPTLEIPRLASRVRTQGDGEAGEAGSPNIMVIVFDAFSARHISAYGYRRETTPNIARWADRATVFHRHYAGGNFTSPGTASLLMGMYPWTHRTLQHYGHAIDAVAHHNVFNLLPDNYYKVAYTHNPLASALLHQFQANIDHLSKRGEHVLTDKLYSDAYFGNDYPVSIYAERVITGLHGRPASATFTQLLNLFRVRSSFQDYQKAYADMFPRTLPHAEFHALFLLEEVTDWLSNLTTTVDDPYFMYIHMFPPHAPYNTRQEFVDIFNDGWTPPVKERNIIEVPGPSDERVNNQRRFYDEFIAYVDAEFGRLMGQLEANGTLDNTYVILTSDHGELFERGIIGHSGMTLYEGMVHIPLMIWKPGEQQRVDVHERTTAADVLPTLLQLTGQPIPEICEGLVLPTFAGAPDNHDSRSIYAVEGKLSNVFAPLGKTTLAQYEGPYKLVRYTGYKRAEPEGTFELFNLENDPEEMENLVDIEKGVAEAMKEQLAQKVAEVDRPFMRI